MHRISWLIVGFLLGVGSLYTVQQYHIVRSDEGVAMVPRVSSGYGDIYVDIRKFELGDWDDHPDVAMALMKDDKSHLLKDAAVGSLRKSMDNLFENF